MTEQVIIEKWRWCSFGYSPKDAATGVCPDFWELPYGCHSCSKWKLLTQEEIHRLATKKDGS